MSTRPVVTPTDISEARLRIAEHVRRTPLWRKEQLSRELSVPVHLKAEHLQRTGSFKIRGAINLMAQLTPDERSRGVVAASAGNHAQGVAVAANTFGVDAHIFMPEDATLSKVEATRGYGATVELVRGEFADALAAAERHCEEHGATFVHPYDDPRIIAGQGTIGLEILEDVPDVGTVIVPIGGGGVFAGVALAIREQRPDCRLIGVQASACPTVSASLQQGRPTSVSVRPTMADGIAVKQPGRLTFDVIQSHMDEIVTVDEDDISRAILWLLERGKQVVEGSGAVGLAALLNRQFVVSGPTVCLLTGGNIDSTLLLTVVRAGLTAAGRFVSVHTTIPDRPGQLSRLLDELARMKVNILSIEHKREGVATSVGEARVDLTLQTRNRAHVAEMLARLADSGYDMSVSEPS